MLVEHLDVGRVDAAHAVLKCRARVIDMAVRERKLHRQVGQLAHERFQAADARKAVDQKRPFAALDEVAQLAAEAADLRDILENPVCREEFGHKNHLSLFLCRPAKPIAALLAAVKAQTVCENVFFTRTPPKMYFDRATAFPATAQAAA